MNRWLHDLQRLLRDGQSCVLVTVAGARGSTPREIGAKMIVTATETAGTIGGGQLEYQCVQTACEWLQGNDAGGDECAGKSLLRKFTLGANCGQCCGGVVDILFEGIGSPQAEWVDRLAYLRNAGTDAAIVTARQSRTSAMKLIVTADAFENHGDELTPDDALLVMARQSLRSGAGACRDVAKLSQNVELPVLIEPVCATDFRVTIFGAGHVGSACASVLSTLDAQVDLVDGRPGLLAGRLPANVRPIETRNAAAVVAEALPNSFYLVMTHDHGLDFEICSRILKRGDAAFCGLIGSRSKRRRFEKRLRGVGFTDADIGGLSCPIGVSGIRGKKPAQIAVAVAAQLQNLYEGRVSSVVDHGRRRDDVGRRDGVYGSVSR